MSDRFYITDAQVAGYAQAARITRNVLCALPKSAQAEQPPALTESQKIALSAALRPKRVTRAEVLLHNDGLLMLLCAGRNANAALIGREDDKNILVPAGGDDLTSTVLAHLLENGEPNSAEASLKTDSDAFLLLLAIADAYRRRYLAGLLNHEAQETPLTLEDLKTTIEDAYNEPDTRWLFPFVLMALDYPVIEDMQAALSGLCSCGILEANGLALTYDGERLADELMYLQAIVHIQTLRARGDTLIREDVLLLRTRESLWCIIPGKEETMLFTLSAENMLELVNAICEELDEPRDDTEVFQAESKKTASQPFATGWRCICGSVNNGSFCPKCGAKRSSVQAARTGGSWLCACGRTNKGAYCPQCGVKRPL